MNKRNDEDIQPLTPEQIRAIGEIEIGPAKHEVFLNRHYKKLIVGGIVFLLAASGAICYATFRQQEEERASASVVEAMKLNAPGKVAAPDGYDGALLATIQSDMRKTNAASTAALMEGLLKLSTDEGRQAGLAQLAEIAEQSPNELIRARAHAALAAFYMGSGEEGKSVDHWKAVVGLPANPYSVIALISLGDLSGNAGDVESARSYYKQAELQHPTSPLTRSGIAELRSMLLEVDVPKPLAPVRAATPSSAQDANPFGTPASASPTGEASFPGTSTLPTTSF